MTNNRVEKNGVASTILSQSLFVLMQNYTSVFITHWATLCRDVFFFLFLHFLRHSCIHVSISFERVAFIMGYICCCKCYNKILKNKMIEGVLCGQEWKVSLVITKVCSGKEIVMCIFGWERKCKKFYNACFRWQEKKWERSDNTSVNQALRKVLEKKW